MEGAPRFGRGRALVDWTGQVGRRLARSLRVDGAAELLLGGTVSGLQAASVWPAAAGLGCCSTGLLSVAGPRWDPEGIGAVFTDDPTGCDVLLLDGPLTRRNRLELPDLLSRMAEPRWTIAVGSCAIGGGPFGGGYAVLGGVDQQVPVDVYIPGCPPSPEAVLLGLVKLGELIRSSAGPHFLVPVDEGGLL
jgi:NADH-quinone oxidoreductase subunit B